jgi:hypothetical protein
MLTAFAEDNAIEIANSREITGRALRCRRRHILVRTTSPSRGGNDSILSYEIADNPFQIYSHKDKTNQNLIAYSDICHFVRISNLSPVNRSEIYEPVREDTKFSQNYYNVNVNDAHSLFESETAGSSGS